MTSPSSIVGRVAAQDTLARAYADTRPALVSVVGRRRIGKTFLVREYFRDRIAFTVTGIARATLREQLANFRLQLRRTYGDATATEALPTWLDAFAALADQLDAHLLREPDRRVVFFDELPWLASRRSGFLKAFSWFWNSWAVDRHIVVVISGSAAAWMIRKVVRDRGGLHNRITHRIRLYPFTLAEVATFMDSRGLVADLYQRLQLYMTFGGVPFYLEQLRSGESATQSIHRLLFERDAPLAEEFGLLYHSLFEEPSHHLAIVRVLGERQVGLTRDALRKAAGISSSGTLARVLEELELSGFVLRSVPFGKSKKDALYRLIDEFSRFHQTYLAGKRSGRQSFADIARTPSYRSWSGYAYENLAIRHAEVLCKALGIGGIAVAASSYVARANDTAEGVQVDLLLDRADRSISLVEAKFTEEPFVLTQAYAKALRAKRARFTAHTGTRKQVYLVLLTTFGLAPTGTEVGIVDHVVEAADLVTG